MRNRYLSMSRHTVIGQHRDRLEFSREFGQAEPLFEKIAALLVCKVPLFEIMAALNFPKEPLLKAKQGCAF